MITEVLGYLNHTYCRHRLCLRTAMENAAPSSSSIAYATAVDWATHRETITRLYWDEANTLREVQRIMKEVHNFHAT